MSLNNFLAFGFNARGFLGELLVLLFFGVVVEVDFGEVGRELVFERNVVDGLLVDLFHDFGWLLDFLLLVVCHQLN